MEKSKRAFKNFLYNRQLRLGISVIIGLAVFFITKSSSSTIVSFMFGWISFAIFHLLFSWIIIFSFHPREVKMFAEKEDSSLPFIFFFVVFAAFISLFAIIVLLQSIPNESRHNLSLHILLAFTSVFCSWTLVHTIFTLRYAHLYYMQDVSTHIDKQPGAFGLDFPNEKEPDYLDFAYFSFVLGMTFQVSDVVINSRKIRRLALLHGLLSFAYNTVIVALSINIVSGLISK
ncbi:MAG: DUF1345 domain-containing protein [Bacteroidota bacterium]|nr:DUF1345 domain-containing protein [Bacteroidota bacterium]